MFTLTVRLGRGATVETFAAVLELEGERLHVAIKRPRPELADREDFLAALEEWGRDQIEIDHPHVVGVLEAGRTEEGAYVIQERVEGAPLSDVLQRLRKRKRSLTPELALSIAEGVAQGLARIHETGYAHGGIDPGEVMVSFDGQVKLGDQGLRALDDVAGIQEDEDKTYWAPETARGEDAALRTDIYAFGLLLLEMLVGFPVWAKGTLSASRAVEILPDYCMIGTTHPELTRELMELLHVCLAEDPQNRFTSGAELVRALEKILAAANLDMVPTRLGRFVRVLVPVRSGEDAPTMIAPAKDMPIEESPEDKNEFKVATVAFREELLDFLRDDPAPRPSDPPHSILRVGKPASFPPPRLSRTPPPTPQRETKLAITVGDTTVPMSLIVALVLLGVVLALGIQRCSGL